MRKLVLSVAACVAAACCGAAHARQWGHAQVRELEAAARAAGEDGLPLPDEAIARLALAEHLYDLGAAPAQAVDRAADALFRDLADAYARGLISPAAVGADWRIARPPPPDLASLEHALDAGGSPGSLLQSLSPRSAEYLALRAELARLSADRTEPRRESRIARLRANLERWRWLPRELPARRIEVRIAQFELTFHHENETPLRHVVIVGAPGSPSPSLAAVIDSVTLNPDWTPPVGIVVDELLPRFRRNPEAAAREGFEAIDGEGRAVDAALVDWRARPFPYALRQRPGPANALGRLRFDMPNPSAVFLHDTPNRRLFERGYRALSHGCIRVQDPLALAVALSTPSEWDEAALRAAIDAGEKLTLSLPRVTPIYLFYFTTALADDGSILYLDDLYGRDEGLAAALDASPAWAR